MVKKLALMAGLTAAICSASLCVAQQPAAAPTDVALAARVVQQTQKFVAANRANDPAANAPLMHEAQAMLRAAMRLDPAEPRYPRLLAEACDNAGDVDGEIAAWSAYRRLLPDDRVAQSRVIELYVGKMQTADARLAYLKDLLTKPSLAPELKAHIAALAVPLLEQRSHDEAVEMIHQARQFYPLSDVLWMEYRLLPPDATLPQRAAAILDLLRANPAQPSPLFDLAHVLSLAGMHEEAAEWYRRANTVLNLMLVGGNLQLGLEVTANLYRIGQIQTSTQLSERLVGQQLFPDSVDAWFLKLTIQKSSITPEQLRLARNVVNKGLDSIAARLKASASTPPSAPTTSPSIATTSASSPATAPSAAADPAALAALAQNAHDPALFNELVRALSDRIWLELYYANNPAAVTPMLEALKTLLPADDVTRLRLEGWYALATAHPDEARQKFTPVADKDPLSLLGLYKIEEAANNKPKAAEIGSQLLAEPTSGVLNAILFQAVKDQNYQPTTLPAASQIKTLLDQFPMDWIGLIEPIEMGKPAPATKFYTLRAEPLKVAHKVGEPLLARLTLTNVGKFDVSIGAGSAGLIEPDLWFDAQLRGIGQDTFPGIAFDRLMGRTILHPSESISQIVRVDQGKLADTLSRMPVGMLSIDADVVLDPLQSPEGVRVGPGGIFAPFSKMFVRTSDALSSDLARGKFFDAMKKAGPMEKLLDLDFLAAYVRYASSGKPEVAPDQAQAKNYLSAIQNERSNADVVVATWAGALSAELFEGAERQHVLEDMTTSPAWQTRLLGALQATQLLPPAASKPIMERLAQNDTDADVKAFAAAALDAPERPATQPTTRP
ncbi:MAG TPA: tetratricopeptide repeat protein [Humisphaera sp.]|jgi:tetratricopeptide (TPR) repeat protein|nr:tetratricopeptide repeat protein [Humisphaera sp.]